MSTATLMTLAVTPCAVAPPLSSPFFHGFTHKGDEYDWYFTRFVAGSHVGFASASALPIPGSFLATDAPAPAVPVVTPTTVTLTSAVLTASTSAPKPTDLVRFIVFPPCDLAHVVRSHAANRPVRPRPGARSRWAAGRTRETRRRTDGARRSRPRARAARRIRCLRRGAGRARLSSRRRAADRRDHRRARAQRTERRSFG